MSESAEYAGLTERDLDLIEVALDACANSVQSGATLRNRRGLDPLAAEYLTTLLHVEQMRRTSSELPRIVKCPECSNGKHANCTGEALDESTDEFVTCLCDHEEEVN